MPWEVAGRLWTLIKGQLIYNRSLHAHLLSSLWRWGLGYSLAVVLGLIAGLTLGICHKLRQSILPIITLIQMIPGLAWIPIALLLFGIGNTATIFMIFIMGFAPIVLNTAVGIQAIPPVQIKAAQIMGANKRTLFFRVLFPSALGSILTGLRIGMAGAWRVLIAAEMIVGMGVGLGYMIIQSRWSLDYESAFIAMGIILFLGLIIEKTLFGMLEARLPYASHQRNKIGVL